MLFQPLFTDNPLPANDHRILRNQLFLCLTFHLARLFLLPILRLRLDFAIYISRNGLKTLFQKPFKPLEYMVLCEKYKAKRQFFFCLFSAEEDWGE